MEERLEQGTDHENQEDLLRGNYLTFWIESQLYGIAIADVEQIVGMQQVSEIVPVPQFPYYAKGIFNFRGEVIPVVDMRLRLDKMEQEYSDHTCLVVVKLGQKKEAIVVDSVEEVTGIGEDEISPPPKLGDSRENAYLWGIGKHNDKVILLLDLRLALGEEELAAGIPF